MPWDDRALFAELMLCADLQSYRMARQQPAPVFFDRGLPDVLGYLRLESLPIPPRLMQAVETFRYNHCVFITPPWQEIFAQDAERKQDFAETVRTFDMMKETYSACGYELIELPRLPVSGRLAFIIQRIGAQAPQAGAVSQKV